LADLSRFRTPEHRFQMPSHGSSSHNQISEALTTSCSRRAFVDASSLLANRMRFSNDDAGQAEHGLDGVLYAVLRILTVK